MKNILIVPSFMADTYSNIEDIYIRMSKDLKDSYNFIWLVRDTKSRYERYKNPHLKGRLEKALFVTELEKNDIKYITAEIDKYDIISNYILFKEIFDKYQIDAVYTHFNFEKYWASLFAKIFSKKVFYNEHMYFESKRGTWKKRALGRSRTAFINSFSDSIIAVSGFIAQDFDPKKTSVVYNAIDVSKYITGASDEDIYEKRLILRKKSREKLGIGEKIPLVVMAAAFRPVKDHHAAVDIIKKTLQKRPEIQFVFAGDGELFESIKKMSEDLAIDGNIIFTGHTNSIQDYYYAADIAMLTSKVEPFGYTVIEAMASMLPLVAFSDTGGPDEIITDLEDGLLIKDRSNERFADAIIRLADDEIMRNSIGSNARKTVTEKFSYSRWIKDIKEVFDRSLSD